MSTTRLARRSFLALIAGTAAPIALPSLASAASLTTRRAATASPVTAANQGRIAAPPVGPIRNGVASRQVAPPTNTAPSIGPAALKKTVFSFYYAWYDAPPYKTSYDHWDGGLTLPNVPANIASPFYPLIPPYDSGNPQVLQYHMASLKVASVDVLVLSWWGQGSRPDRAAAAILTAAAANGFKVAFQIEPYPGRTLSSIVADIAYIYANYGASPAFYRVARPTAFGPSTKARGVFFIYNLPGGAATVATFDALRGGLNDALILARMSDGMLFRDSDVRLQLSYSHVDGLYSYDPYPPAAALNLATLPSSSDYVLVYSLVPGRDASRTPPYVASNPLPRQNGAFYDDQWGRLIANAAENVAVVSFNEWNEGTQIEAATPFSCPQYTYQDYRGAYGMSDSQSPFAYLARTAYWAQQYRQ